MKIAESVFTDVYEEYPASNRDIIGKGGAFSDLKQYQ